MALWGKTDANTSSPLYVQSQLKRTANSTNQDAAFGNTSAWFGKATGKQVAGVFGVDTTEARVSAGPLALGRVITAGSGYTANATITITAVSGGSSGVANAQSNSTGRIAAVNISTAGTGYKANPTVVISAPAATAFNANTAVTGGTGAGSNNVIALSSAPFFQAGDKITYAVAAGNTVIAGLTSGTQYYVQFANATVVALATTAGGTRIALTPSTTSETGHTLQGETATGFIVAAGGQNKGVTAGWNLRTAGTGGRAGRVQNECLVAMRSISTDASDDTILNDA
jgi:hypothetical protein